jgi:hypothetical protein
MAEPGDPLRPEELGDGKPLPARELLSVLGDPSADAASVLETIEHVQSVPAADEAPVGDDRYTIQPVEDEA